MNTSRYTTIILALGLISTACEFDNFDPPTSTLSGQVVFNGEPVQVRSDEIELELWQNGFEFRQDIPVFVDQDGSFSATLFDGEYQLVLRNGNGPWVNNSDSITIQLQGEARVDMPVELFYNINNESVAFSGGNINATFQVESINDSQDLESVNLFVGTHTILDNVFSEAESSLGGDEVTLGQTVDLSLELPGDLSSRSYVFARVGIKVEGRQELLFSPVYRIDL
ncbi:MAG: DUF3823 domain-containing protein [Bacteroidota bacterium]